MEKPLEGTSHMTGRAVSIGFWKVLRQPILAITPILLKMNAPATLQWFGGSFVMHLILSIVLGLIVGYGLWHATFLTQRPAQ